MTLYCIIVIIIRNYIPTALYLTTYYNINFTYTLSIIISQVISMYSSYSLL